MDWAIGVRIMRHRADSITEIQMPSSAAECSRLRKVINRLASAALHNPCAVADVELAVGEAFSNAVKHGKRNAKVSVRVAAKPNRELAVEMAYPGLKFDTKVTYPKNVRKATGGFGRYIMQQVLDGMEYSFRNGYTTLRMTKRR